MLGVGIDVAAQLPGQIGGGGEDAARDDVALHLYRTRFPGHTFVLCRLA